MAIYYYINHKMQNLFNTNVDIEQKIRTKYIIFILGVFYARYVILYFKIG